MPGWPSWLPEVGFIISGGGLLWRWFSAYPLLVIERRKTRAMAELDTVKDEVIGDLRTEISSLRSDLAAVRGALPASSTGSPEPTPTSPMTPPSSPADNR